MGDSCTLGTGQRNEETYPAQLAELLGLNYSVKSAGLCGAKAGADDSQGTQYICSKRCMKALNECADVYTIMLGSNDAVKGVPVARIRSGLLSLIQKIRNMVEVAVVVLVVPPGLKRGCMEANLPAVRRAVRQAAEECSVALVEPAHMDDAQFYQIDRIHLSHYGASQIASAIAPSISGLHPVAVLHPTVDSQVRVIESSTKADLKSFKLAAERIPSLCKNVIDSREVIISPADTKKGKENYEGEKKPIATIIDGVEPTDALAGHSISMASRSRCSGDSSKQNVSVPAIVQTIVGSTQQALTLLDQRTREDIEEMETLSRPPSLYAQCAPSPASARSTSQGSVILLRPNIIANDLSALPKVFTIGGGYSTTVALGRARGNAIALPMAHVSRHHCQLKLRKFYVAEQSQLHEALFLHDISVHGTFANGIAAHRPTHWLIMGDEIGVYRDPSDATSLVNLYRIFYPNLAPTPPVHDDGDTQPAPKRFRCSVCCQLVPKTNKARHERQHGIAPRRAGNPSGWAHVNGSADDDDVPLVSLISS